MSPQMKKESEGEKVMNNTTVLEPEPIETDRDEYEDEPQEIQGESSEVAEEEPFGSEHVFDAAEKARQEDLAKLIVKKINVKYRQGVDNGKMEIGRMILEEVFNGKVENAVSTDPFKSRTFSLVANSRDLIPDSKTVASWVRAAAVAKSFTLKEQSFPHLTTYHYVELATVRDDANRLKLAAEANEKELSVKALSDLVRQTKGTTKSETDRLKQEMERSLRHFVALPIDDELSSFAADKEAIRGAYPADKAIKCLPEVNRCVANAKAGAEVLGVFANNLKAIVNEAMEPLSD